MRGTLANCLSGISLLAVLCASSARGADVETLPQGVWSAQVRYGVISGLQDTWGSDGKLYNLGELHSISFDAATLAKVNPRGQALIQALNYFGSQDLGSKINLGTLNVSTSPEISYVAPVMAYGINDRWTIGVGLPVIHYLNHMSLSASSSNLAFYRQQFGGMDKALDDALNIDIVAEAEKVLAAKGYKPLTNRDEQFLGDVEVSVLHKLPELGSWHFLHQLTFVLPTGPKDDPSDLEAVDYFGRAEIENTLVAGYEVLPGLALMPYTGLLVPLPDTVSRRVPLNEDDLLPDANQLEDVNRWLAPTLTVGGTARLTLFTDWALRTGAEASWKGADRYSGTGRMDLLEANSDTFLTRVLGGIDFSTIDRYRSGRAKFPTKVSAEVSDTVLGRNFNRELITEISAMLFF